MSESDESARKRRAAALLGDLLPNQTRDDLDEPGNEKGDTSRDRQIADDVPPHHGS